MFGAVGRWATRSTVEAYARVDVRQLRRSGLLQVGQDYTSRWSSGLEVRSTVLADGLRLEHEGRSYVVRLEWEPLHYGGVRPWFRCPVAGCGRRCGVLYRSGVFACRRCVGAVYRSQRVSRADRLAWKVDRLMARLGSDSDRNALFVPKPTRMWWRTYERLVREAEATEAARVMSILGGSAAWLRRMEARHGR
jgi:hypothetical protein